MAYTEALNTFVALGTIGMQIWLGVVGLSYVIPQWEYIRDTIRTWAFHAALFLSLVATSITLVYSEIVGFIPCDLCWFGRIFLYPQVFIYGIGLYLRDENAFRYGLALSSTGAIVSLYHYYIEMGGKALFTCSTEAVGISCAKVYILEFGYVTFSLMGVTLFAVLATLAWIRLRD